MTMWLTLGLLLGVAVTIGAAGSSVLRDVLLKRIFRSNREGWLLRQSGNRYELKPLQRADDADAFLIGNGDQESSEWVEDKADRMHSLFGVPVGLALDPKRPIVDVETAAAAEGLATKSTDGGLIRNGQVEHVSHEELKEALHIGTVEETAQQGQQVVQETIHYINPFMHHEDAPEIVDLRRVAQWFRHDADSDAPKKAAKNAVEAERAFDSLSDLKEFGKVLASFIAGAVAAFIGSSGGGGGGGVSVPLMLDVLAVVV